MGVAGGPDLIQDGLVLDLDASDRNSYVSGSTTWFDLSGNDNHFTLYNGPTFSNNIITLDGIDDYMRSINTINLTTTNAVTVILYMKANTYGTSVKILYELSTNFNNREDCFVAAFSDNSVGQDYEVLASVKGNVNFYIASYSKTMLNDLAWNQHTIIHNTAQPTTEVIMYGNGQAGTVVQNPVPSYNANNTNNFGNQPLFIGSRAGSSLFAPMSLGGIQIYNRALTQAEIQQNYTALKSKFGL
jgi:hypothetical protein